MSLQDRIYDFLLPSTKLTEDKLIWSDEDAPRPALPYVSMKITSLLPIGFISRSKADEDGKSKLIQHYEINLSVQYYGDDSAYNELLLLSLRLQSMKSIELGRNLHIAFVRRQSISDTTQLLDSRFEKRASSDLILRSAVYEEEVNELIDKITVSGSISGRDIDFDINI